MRQDNESTQSLTVNIISVAVHYSIEQLKVLRLEIEGHLASRPVETRQDKAICYETRQDKTR
eukprot:4936588-Ditylum_brightwellii.AAC.1